MECVNNAINREYSKMSDDYSKNGNSPGDINMAYSFITRQSLYLSVLAKNIINGIETSICILKYQ